jgi:transcriptional regulator with XRE-family HTH domain
MITTMNTKRTGRHPFGAWLETQMAALGMKPIDLARKIEVSHVTVGRWLNGRQPDAKYIDALADALLLDYDLVSERAGYRPRLPKERLDVIHERLDPRLVRVHWDDSRFRMIESILNQFIQDDDLKRSSALTDTSSPESPPPGGARPPSGS